LQQRRISVLELTISYHLQREKSEVEKLQLNGVVKVHAGSFDVNKVFWARFFKADKWLRLGKTHNINTSGHN
jgi:hypothetical protein